MVEVVLGLQVQICLEQKLPQYRSRLFLVAVHVADSIEVERMFYSAAHQSIKVSKVLYLLSYPSDVYGPRDNLHVFHVSVILYLLVLIEFPNLVQHVTQLSVQHPLGKAASLLYFLKRFLSSNLFLVLENISFDQVPVLQLFLFNPLLISAHQGHRALSVNIHLLLLYLSDRDAKLPLLAQHVQILALLSLDLKSLLPRLLLLLFHLSSELLERVCLGILVVVWVLINFMFTQLPITAWVREGHLHVDRAALM